jgi:hypothetical protein
VTQDPQNTPFERAADAIIAGDLAALERLLSEHADLVNARSGREHEATLLHYVSANGVEDDRQRTPANIVAIARRLLDAGADVDAEADVYGGGATTLYLVVTSTPPRQAGVQLELADLLIGRGARLRRDLVRSCLMNGCPEAAAHMAAHGAHVGVEEAAGLGRLDLLATYFEPPGIVPPADQAAALLMAAWYDRREVVAWLLDRGADPASHSPEAGSTPLHVAAYLGYAELVELLVERGAPLDVIDAVYGTPPLVWALHGWLVEARGPAQRYQAVLRTLAEAGAQVKSEWLDDERLKAEPELYAALLRRRDP